MTRIQIVRFAAVAAAICAAMVCVGCGSHGRNDSGETGQIFRSGEYVGAGVCITCHRRQHADWLGTLHKGALQTLVNAGNGSNQYCLGCHTVGFGQATGFVSIDQTPELGGVQCENCHGPGGGHVHLETGGRLAENEFDIISNPSAEICGQCHLGSHHPTYTEWQDSKHAVALPTLQANPYANDSCLECHSADYRLAADDAKPTLQTAEFSITCVVCHNPHSNAVEDQLRLEPAELCIECHNKEGSLPGQTVHHPQKEMLLGLDGAGLGEHPNSEHATIPRLCIECHKYTQAYADEENPGITGHKFTIDFNACIHCHGGTASSNEAMADERQTVVHARLAAIKTRLDAIPQDLRTTTEYLQAKYYYEFVDQEASYGVHNAKYADALMAGAEDRLTQLEAP